MNRRDLTIGAIAAGVVLVASLGFAHFRDAGRDKELERLHGIITRDSTVRVAAAAKTDSAIARADTATKTTAHADSGWTRARDAAAQARQIAQSTKPDTVKIRELVQKIDTLIVAGDSLKRAADADTAAIAQLRVSFAGERLAWATERKDLSHALEVSQSRHRHWGLGATVGYGVVRDNSGVIRAGPSLAVGLSYRW